MSEERTIKKIAELSQQLEELEAERMRLVRSARQRDTPISWERLARATATPARPSGLSPAGLRSRVYNAYPDTAPPSLRRRDETPRRRTRRSHLPGVGVNKAARVLGVHPDTLRARLNAGKDYREGTDFLRIEDASTPGGVALRVIRPEIIQAVEQAEAAGQEAG